MKKTITLLVAVFLAMSAFLIVTPVSAVPMDVGVDIKPGSFPNPLNVNKRGVLSVAICGTESFDVTQIDPASIFLGPTVPPLRWSLEDVATPFDGGIGDGHELGADGYLDLVLKYDAQEVVAALGTPNDGDVLVLAFLGNLKAEFGGTPIIGVDVVVIIKKS
jgi:hypothetical protein